MKIYRIAVEGKTYEVEVEEMESRDATPDAAEKPAPKPKTISSVPPRATPPPPPRAVPSAPVASGNGTGEITAPMGGTILSIAVKQGDTVAAEDVLLSLEAMKLENEIRAQQAGTVIEVLTSEGAKVNAGDVLLTIG
jgi:glutaconyl-CoA decarboxylase